MATIRWGPPNWGKKRDFQPSLAPAVLQCWSVSFVYSIKIYLQIISPSGSHTILVFPYQTLWQQSNGDPLTGAENVIFNHYLALALMTAGLSSVVNIQTAV